MRILFKTLFIFSMIGSAWAQELGVTTVHSSLGEPLNVSIPVEGAGTITAAAPAEYLRLNLTRPPQKGITLKTDITKTGSTVRIFSAKPINEPLFSLLLKIESPTGQSRLEEVYIMLNPAPKPEEIEAATQAKTPVEETDQAQMAETAVNTKETKVIAGEQATSAYGSSGKTYTVRNGDTLGKIANQLSPKNTKAMLHALQAQNPHAFRNPDKVTTLKAGAVLQVPDLTKKLQNKENKIDEESLKPKKPETEKPSNTPGTPGTPGEISAEEEEALLAMKPAGSGSAKGSKGSKTKDEKADIRIIPPVEIVSIPAKDPAPAIDLAEQDKAQKAAEEELAAKKAAEELAAKKAAEKKAADELAAKKAAEKKKADELAAKKAAEKQKTATKTPPPPPPPPTFLEEIQTFVMDNILIVAGGIFALVAIPVAVLVMRRKRGGEEIDLSDIDLNDFDIEEKEKSTKKGLSFGKKSIEKPAKSSKFGKFGKKAAVQEENSAEKNEEQPKKKGFGFGAKKTTHKEDEWVADDEKPQSFLDKLLIKLRLKKEEEAEEITFDDLDFSDEELDEEDAVAKPAKPAAREQPRDSKMKDFLTKKTASPRLDAAVDKSELANKAEAIKDSLEASIPEVTEEPFDDSLFDELNLEIDLELDLPELKEPIASALEDEPELEEEFEFEEEFEEVALEPEMPTAPPPRVKEEIPLAFEAKELSADDLPPEDREMLIAAKREVKSALSFPVNDDSLVEAMSDMTDPEPTSPALIKETEVNEAEVNEAALDELLADLSTLSEGKEEFVAPPVTEEIEELTYTPAPPPPIVEEIEELAYTPTPAVEELEELSYTPAPPPLAIEETIDELTSAPAEEATHPTDALAGFVPVDTTEEIDFVDPQSVLGGVTTNGFSLDEDSIELKLSLADAYIHMEDFEGATDMLDEVKEACQAYPKLHAKYERLRTLVK